MRKLNRSMNKQVVKTKIRHENNEFIQQTLKESKGYPTGKKTKNKK